VWAGGSHPPQAPATRHPPARRRSPACVCGAAAPPRQGKRTALHIAASRGHAPCAESLIKAGTDASLKGEVSDGAEGRGGRRGGGFGARGQGGGCGGRGPCSQASRRLSAPPSPRPLPPGAAASTSAPPPPRRRMATRRWTKPRTITARRSSSSWRTLLRRSAAPRRTPPPRRPAPAPCATDAWSRIPGCSLTQRPRALSPDHSSPSTPNLKMGMQCICTHVCAYKVISIQICICIYLYTRLPLPPPLPQPHPQVQHGSTCGPARECPSPLHRLGAGVMN